MRTKLAFGIIALFLLAACAQPVEKVEPIKIGAVFPLTGAWATGAEAGQRGILIALDEINAQGGINSRPVEVIFEDTKSEVPQAVTAAQKLINVDKLPIIIGGFTSAESIAIAPIAQETKTVLFVPLSLTTELEKAGEWVFKLRESTSLHADITLKEMAKRGYKKLGIIAQSWEACDDFLEQMGPLYAKHGITLVSVEKYGGKDTDMRTQIAKLKEADIDTWFACGAYQDTGLVFKQSKELGFNKPAFGMVAVESKKLFEVAGDAAEGAIFGSTKWSCDNAQAFCDTFKQKYNSTPDYRAAFGYDALKIVAEAIKREGYSSEGIQKGLLSIQDYVGAGGKTSFDAEGNAQKEVILKQVKGDKFVELKE